VVRCEKRRVPFPLGPTPASLPAGLSKRTTRLLGQYVTCLNDVVLLTCRWQWRFNWTETMEGAIMTKKDSSNLNRRGFLARVLGVAGAGAATFLIHPAQTVRRKLQSRQPAGYRETDHVRRYYRNARF